VSPDAAKIELDELGSDGQVEPLRSLGEIRAIKSLLAGRPRDLLVFTLGINNALRAGDLMRVTVNQVRSAGPGESVAIPEKRNGSTAPLAISCEAWEALHRHLALLTPPPPPQDMYLFGAHRGWTPLTVQRLDDLVREWARGAGVPGRFGAHTLRKTFGYLQRTVYGVGFEVLALRYGHASPQVTMRYLGLASGPGPAVRLNHL